MNGRATIVLVVVAALVVVVLPHPAAALTVTRAELRDGDLRVEGEDAVAGAAILVDGEVLGQADDGGDFRIEVSGFSSPTCRITVDDGTGPVEVELDRCTPTDPDDGDDADEPEAGAPAEPTWSAFRHHLMEGKAGRLRVSNATTGSDGPRPTASTPSPRTRPGVRDLALKGVPGGWELLTVVDGT